MPIEVKYKFSTNTLDLCDADLHPDRPWLLTGHSDGTAKIYNLASWKFIHSFNTTFTYICCVKFIARKDWYVVGSKDGKLRVFNCTTREEVITLKAHTGPIRCLAVHPTAPIILTGSDDKTIKAWDWENQWRKVQRYKGHSKWIWSITFNQKDTNTFASASGDCTVKMWSITSPIPLFTVKAHDGSVHCVNFYHGADKPYFITAGSDGTVKVWDYHSQTCVQTMNGHNAAVRFAVFHPTLPVIISGCLNGTVIMWNRDSYEIEHTLKYELQSARCITFCKEKSEVTLGFEKAVIILKLVNTRPLQITIDMGGEASKEQVQPLLDGRDTKELAIKDQKQELYLTQSLDSLTTAYDANLSLSPPSTTPTQPQILRNKADPYQQCITLAMKLISNKTTNKLISELKDDNAQHVADLLSKMVSDKETFNRSERKHSLYLLSKLAKSAHVFPRSREIEGVQCDLTTFVAAGGYGFIYKGEHNGRPVCVKAVQIGSQGIDRTKMRAHASELTIWAHLDHQNVLPFLGIYASKEKVPRICVVSPWMNNGDLLQYLKTVPEIPRKPLVCDIISGLQYLHDLDIIHADLKARNVLISETGKAMLADFGISRLSMTQTTMLTNIGIGTAYWMAPELLLEQKAPSRESDIWAFACTCYEIFTGTMPFSRYYNIASLMGAFVMGKFIPEKPAPGLGWDEDVWSIATRCWQGDPASRPSAQEILEMMKSGSSIDIEYDRVLSILNKTCQTAGV